MMVIGAALNMIADFFISDEIYTQLSRQSGACIFMFGAICFAVMQIMQKHAGNSLTINRLRAIMTIGDICFIIAGLLLIENAFRIVYPYFTSDVNNYNFYIQYINNNWVMFLLIATILEVYTTHRIAYEIGKEKK